jgi:hypothetical protein
VELNPTARAVLAGGFFLLRGAEAGVDGAAGKTLAVPGDKGMSVTSMTGWQKREALANPPFW